MVIGFLGKGGSGKSTLSTLMTNYLVSSGNFVLAVDADHNMDLSYNLGYKSGANYIGGTFLPLREELGISIEDKTDILFANDVPEKRFFLNPKDEYTEKYTYLLRPNLHLMMSGPQNEDVLYGSHCSHSLAAPLKIYLPLLTLKENEFVVVDEKASVDAVTTGIPTGFDLAVVCAEPKEHSLRVALQITEALEWYSIPYCLAINKFKDSDMSFVKEFLGKSPDVFISLENDDPLNGLDKNKESLEKIKQLAKAVSQPNVSRIERTQNKYRRNLEYVS